jgi:hypothetical protein
MARAHSPAGSQQPLVELTVRQGPRPGQRFSLTRPTITIGREAGNDVVVNHGEVSRRHASLTWDGRQFIIQDLGSANGTFVNGVRLTGPQVLQQGDVIGLGSMVLLGFQALPEAAAPPAYAPPPPAYAPRPPARRRGRFLIPLTALLGLCFVLAVAAALGYFFLRRGETKPLVSINSPRHGERVEVGQEVTVHSIVRDEGKVTRVELWVDGQLQETQSSNLPGGTSPFPLLARWQPSSPGTHTLIARAFNAQGVRAHASVKVEAIEKADRDGDEVADEADACPDEPGATAADGCPDGDSDGISDADDACPDEAGLPEGDGCPVSSEGDRDGDGLLDEADACPDEPGSPRADGCPDADDDGIPDAEDACPAEPGLPENDGCPVEGDLDGDGVPDAEDDCPEESGLPEHAGCSDSDGDGVRDVDDACLDEPGLPAHAGCPDRDNDGVRDRDDQCPDQAGPTTNGGCPVTGAGDRDHDGLTDDVDGCPDEAGQPAHAGCPPPGMAEDRNGNGLSDDEEATDDPVLRVLQLIPGGLVGVPPVPSPSDGTPPPGGGIPVILTPIEIEALEFRVFREYDQVNCYVLIEHPPYGETEIRAGSLDPAGGRSWDLGAHFGSENRRSVQADTDFPVQIHIECDADDPAYRDLGSITVSHPYENEDGTSDWDGHVIGQRSSGGSDGHSFWVSYRICRPSCSAVPFHPPQIWLEEYAGSAYLAWLYYGDPTSIRGFGIYRNGAIVGRRLSDEPFTGGSGWTPAGATAYAYAFPSSWRPACGTSDEFHVTTYGNDARESPPSNTATWDGQPCPRTVRIIFQTLETGNLGGDEREYDTVGPISGNFWASGNTREELDFHASVCAILSSGCPHRDIRHGFRLSHNATYQIQDIFDWVHTEQAECSGRGCEANHYWAPDVNSVTVQLDDGDDLTFGARIQDVDWGSGRGSEWDTLFDNDRTIAADELRLPGEYPIRDRNIVLRVRVMAPP